jgi:hypothetical protein
MDNSVLVADFTDETYKMVIDHINTLNDKDMYECWRKVGIANVNNAIRVHKEIRPRIVRYLMSVYHSDGKEKNTNV